MTYTPAADSNGPDSFSYSVDDGASSDTATISISVDAINHAPAGTNKTVATLEDTPYTFDTTDFGFSDPTDIPPNSLFAVKVTTVPAAGVLKDNGSTVTAGEDIALADITGNKLVYTPGPNGDGNAYATFTFQVRDDGGTVNGGVDLDQSPNTMTIDVTPVNDAPVGTNKTVTTLEDTPYTFDTADFGFSDPNDSPANSLVAVKITTVPAAGVLQDNGTTVTAGDEIALADITGNKLVFTPGAGGTGAAYAAFTFQVRDNGGTANGGVDLDQSANIISISVDAINHAPAGTNKTVATLEDTPYTFDTTDFGFSDPTDIPPNSLFAVKVTTVPAAGVLKDNGSTVTAGEDIALADITGNKLVYTPGPNGDGNAYATFTFQVRDDGGTVNGGVDLDQSPNTMTIDVTPVNDAPVGTNKTVTTLEDTPYTFDTADFGFSDPNDSPANSLVAVKITTVPAAGVLQDTTTLPAVTLQANDSVPIAQFAAGKVVFVPVPDANGAAYATFTFQVRDDGGTANGGVDLDQSPNTMTIDVTPVNDVPVVTDDSSNVGRNAPATAVDVLGNDTDVDTTDTLTIIAKTDGLKGTVVITGGGTGLTYQPATDQTGADSFTYTVTDGHSAGLVGTVSVIIADGALPVANDDSITMLEDAAATAIPVLANDTDADVTDVLTITGKTNGAKGTVTLTSSTTLTYKPNLNANGSDTFTYTIYDGHGGSATGQVTVTITPVNDKPDARNDTSFTVPESAGARTIPVLANDIEVDGDTLLIIGKTNGAHGVVAITGGGTGLTYNPNQLYYGTDVFTYTVSDGHGQTDSATVLLTVVKDTVKPVTIAPVQTFYNQTSGSSTVKIKVAWSGSDAGGTGVARYTLQVSVNSHAYTTISLSSATATSVTRTLTINSTYRFRVRATDRQGNVGSYAYGPTFKAARLQNTSSSAHYLGPWTTSSSASALGGSHRYTSTVGASVSFTGSMRNIAWMATKTTSSGSAQVWIDGSLAATINLRATKTLYKQLVYHRDFGALGTHTIEIRSLGGGRVYFDAFAVLL